MGVNEEPNVKSRSGESENKIHCSEHADCDADHRSQNSTVGNSENKIPLRVNFRERFRLAVFNYIVTQTT